MKLEQNGAVRVELALEELNSLKKEMEANGLGEDKLEILAFTIESGFGDPATMSEAAERQERLELQYPVGAYEEFGEEYIGISGYFPTMMVLAPYPANDQGLVIVGFGKYNDVSELFDSKSKLENLYSGDYAEEICPQDDTDGDGTPDIFDSDIDDDGVANDDDDFPYDRNETIDSDLDGIGNNADDDDDGDGVLDINDECPETKILYAGSYSIYYENGCADIDGDGYNETVDCDDTEDTVFSDRDGDGWCDKCSLMIPQKFGILMAMVLEITLMFSHTIQQIGMILTQMDMEIIAINAQMFQQKIRQITST